MTIVLFRPIGDCVGRDAPDNAMVLDNPWRHWFNQTPSQAPVSLMHDISVKGNRRWAFHDGWINADSMAVLEYHGLPHGNVDLPAMLRGIAVV